jgi:hypothetical protein
MNNNPFKQLPTEPLPAVSRNNILGAVDRTKFWLEFDLFTVTQLEITKEAFKVFFDAVITPTPSTPTKTPS